MTLLGRVDTVAGVATIYEGVAAPLLANDKRLDVSLMEDKIEFDRVTASGFGLMSYRVMVSSETG